jgi:glycine cleavage system aminomethyltransferase T
MELAEVGTEVSIEVFGDWVDAEVVDDPLWDPSGARIRS